MRETDNYHAINSVQTPISEESNSQFSKEKFSGSQTVKVIKTDKESSLSSTWDVEVKRGKFKIVLTDTQNKKIVETICDGSGSGNLNVHNLPAGKYQVKFVGDNATVEGKFSMIAKSVDIIYSASC